MAEPEPGRRLITSANHVAQDWDADVLVYSGAIDAPFDARLIDACAEPRQARPNVYLILVTYGGSAHAAYRMARCLPRKYKRVIACIPGPCSSAGTLFAIGAHELVMSDHGILGPLDVQIRKADELFEVTSGLTALEALETLRSESFAMFENNLLDLKGRSQGQITLRTAMDIAQKLTTGLFNPIYAQIDPIRLGDDGRQTRIAEEYGTRLDKKSQNLRPGALQRLVAEYPTHLFEIDREEAEELFKSVKKPTPHEIELIGALGPAATQPLPQTSFGFISQQSEMAEEKTNGKEYSTDSEGKKQEAASAGAGSTLEATPDGRGEGSGRLPRVS